MAFVDRRHRDRHPRHRPLPHREPSRLGRQGRRGPGATRSAFPQFLLLLRRPGPLRWTAAAGGLFLAAVALASALSPLKGFAFLGQYGASSGVGWLFYLCLVSFWALGATLDDSGPRLVHDAIVIACVLDAVALFFSLFTEQSSAFGDLMTHIPGIFTDSGQALGLMDNPVFSGALLAGGVALLATTSRFSRKARFQMLAVVALGLELSGSRMGILLSLAVLAWIALGAVGCAVPDGRRSRSWAGWRPVTSPTRSSEEPTSVRGSPAPRAAGPSGARLQEVAAALHVTMHHPFVGIGPAQTQTALAPYWLGVVRPELPPVLRHRRLLRRREPRPPASSGWRAC